MTALVDYEDSGEADSTSTFISTAAGMTHDSGIGQTEFSATYDFAMASEVYLMMMTEPAALNERVLVEVAGAPNFQTVIGDNAR